MEAELPGSPSVLPRRQAGALPLPAQGRGGSLKPLLGPPRRPGPPPARPRPPPHAVGWRPPTLSPAPPHGAGSPQHTPAPAAKQYLGSSFSPSFQKGEGWI